MVFVWSYLTDGDPAYTLVQVAVNDLIMLVLFAPIVGLLVGGASAWPCRSTCCSSRWSSSSSMPLAVGVREPRSLLIAQQGQRLVREVASCRASSPSR